jgi:hypothetical protein
MITDKKAVGFKIVTENLISYLNKCGSSSDATKTSYIINLAMTAFIYIICGKKYSRC